MKTPAWDVPVGRSGAVPQTPGREPCLAPPLPIPPDRTAPSPNGDVDLQGRPFMTDVQSLMPFWQSSPSRGDAGTPRSFESSGTRARARDCNLGPKRVLRRPLRGPA